MDGKFTRREVLAGAAAMLAVPLAGRLMGAASAAEAAAADVNLGKAAQFQAVGVKDAGDYVVVTEAGGVMYCMSRKCTHKFVPINFDAKQNKFVCPAHGAMFDKQGTVLQKPAKTDLPWYTLEVRGDDLYVLPSKVVPKGTLYKVGK